MLFPFRFFRFPSAPVRSKLLGLSENAKEKMITFWFDGDERRSYETPNNQLILFTFLCSEVMFVPSNFKTNLILAGIF